MVMHRSQSHVSLVAVSISLEHAMLRILTLLMVVLSVTPVYSATLSIPLQYASIQAAIDAATSGDTILVAPGTYQERLNFKGKNIVVRSEAGAASTIIDATGSGEAITMDQSEPATAVLEGFTIRNGQGPGGCCRGGGLTCVGCAAQIRYNIFENNHSWNGGAIAVLGSNGTPAAPRILGNQFRNNSAQEFGGAIVSMNSNPIIEDNQIDSNQVSGYPVDLYKGPAGGGIYVSYATAAQVRGNDIHHNSAEHGGGGLFVIESAATIERNRFHANEARFGGGIHVEATSGLVTIRQNLFQLNEVYNLYPGDDSLVLGGGVGAFRSDTLIENNRFVANSAFGNLCGLPSTADRCGFGGALSLFGGTASVRDNLILGNQAELGGGVWLSREPDGVEALIEGNRIERNKAMARPGLECADGADCTILGNVIVGNGLLPGAPTSGGAIPGAGGLDIQDGAAVVINNVIAANQGHFGGGVKIQRSDAIFTNNTVVDNRAVWVGGGLIMEGIAGQTPIDVDVFNNLFAGNDLIALHELGGVSPRIGSNLFHDSATGVYSAWNGGAPQIKTTVAALNALTVAHDNLAADPALAGGSKCADYHLSAASGARNAGDDLAPRLPTTDIDGESRILDGRVDIGSDEYSTAAPAPCLADTPGIYRDSDRQWYLRADNSAGIADVQIAYGNPSDVAIAGDWDGDGYDTVGIYRDNTFYLRNANSAGPADTLVGFGAPGDIPVVGDWDGDGIDTIGVYRPANGAWYLRNTNTPGDPDLAFVYGLPNETPVTGDWDGDGIDTIGIFRASDRSWYLRNTNGAGYSDLDAIPYGDPANDSPVTGDWDGDGIDTFGVYRAATGTWYLRNSHTPGAADLAFDYGLANEKPLVGRWDRLLAP